MRHCPKTFKQADEQRDLRFGRTKAIKIFGARWKRRSRAPKRAVRFYAQRSRAPKRAVSFYAQRSKSLYAMSAIDFGTGTLQHSS